MTRVSPTLVVASSWVLGLVPTPSLIGHFAEHPVLCRRVSRQPSPTVSLSSTLSRPDGRKYPEGPEPLSMALCTTRSSQHPLLVSKVNAEALHCFKSHRAPTRSSQHPLLISKVISESMSPSPLYPGMRRPCAAFNCAVHQPGATSTPFSSQRSMRRPCAAFNRAMRTPPPPDGPVISLPDADPLAEDLEAKRKRRVI
ncbi:hypothetical protein B0H14DRAFT_2585455 [Mycena olivaceomarginata]|nr:hypothetical protein B0H14DRAFT_2585455 [Mycena olivaceomarginata]